MTTTGDTATTPGERRPEAPTGVALALLSTLAATTSAGAGILHLGHAPHHAADLPALGLAFALVGWVQVLTGALLLVRPTRRLLAVVVATNIAAIAAWAIVHARGWPFGPLAGVTEQASAYDVAAVALELATVVIAAMALRRLPADPPRRWVLRGPSLLTTAVVVAVTSLALAGPAATHADDHGESATGAPVHDDDGHDGDEHDSVVHDHPPCDEEVTAAQQQGADELLATTETSLATFADVADALAAGYEPWASQNGGTGSHYVNRDHVLDGELLDPTRPESLVYLPVPGERLLIGAMYLAPNGSTAPTPGGCLTRWHAHSNACIESRKGIVAEAAPGGTCPAGSEQRETMQMLHVWTIEVPDPFGDSLDRETLVPAIRTELRDG
ncbi:hypothetical protein BH20ACT2_BH20ACT2_16100 [soil metagenome]